MLKRFKVCYYFMYYRKTYIVIFKRVCLQRSFYTLLCLRIFTALLKTTIKIYKIKSINVIHYEYNIASIPYFAYVYSPLYSKQLLKSFKFVHRQFTTLFKYFFFSKRFTFSIIIRIWSLCTKLEFFHNNLCLSKLLEFVKSTESYTF